MYYTGRDMKTSHRGMNISAADWSRFMEHVHATLKRFGLPDDERGDVVAFIESTQAEIVEG